jgi:hypothetical protein
LSALPAVLDRTDDSNDIAWVGVEKPDLLRHFRAFAYRTCFHDNVGDIFASLNPHAFQRCFDGQLRC